MLILAMALPAAAARPAHAGKGKGKPAKASKAQTTQITEDNDTNDNNTPNNVVDGGDNRHPSGKDKSVERGGSGNQGRSQSDPDGDSNGGLDKPDGSGGIDLADQDGNNGCGNDDDFEDDNNGNCGPKVKAAPAKAKPAKAKPAKAKPAKAKPAKPDMIPAEGACTPGTNGCAMPAEGACGSDGTACAPSGEAACSAGTGECVPTEVADVTGSPAVVDSAVGTTPSGGVLGAEGEVEDETLVAGVSVDRPAGTARVLGASDSRPAVVAGPSRALAATGAPALILALLSLAGMGVGSGIVRRTRKR